MKRTPKAVPVKPAVLTGFPCEKLDYCPYGWLVEIFPLHGKKCEEWDGTKIGWLAVDPIPEAKPCPFYGHDCPALYTAEQIPDELVPKK